MHLLFSKIKPTVLHLFLRFLIANNAYLKYIFELKRKDEARKGLEWDPRVCFEEPDELIGGAFFWYKTLDGADYWRNINNAWMKLISFINENKRV